MTRNQILFFVAIVSVAIATAYLGSPYGITRGLLTPAVSAAADIPTTLSQPVVQDNFDDNKKGTLWKAYVEDANCAVKETSKHLEFTAKAGITSGFAGYVGDKWSIDPNHNFTMKVHVNYDPVTMEGGWLTFGVTPLPDEPRQQYVAFGVGCVSLFQSYWREWRKGYEVRWTFDGRAKNDVMLYLTYESASDTLYMGDVGYGRANAWEIIPGLIRGRWGPKPLYVFIGLNTEGANVTAGRAFADDFSLDTGVLVAANTPSDPNDPNNKPPDGGQQVEVLAEASVLPSVITRQGMPEPITAFLSLPKGLLPGDIDETQPLVLLPGGAQATRRSTFVWLTGQAIVIASFDRAKLLEAVPANGDASVQIVGRLEDGRYFGGIDTVKIQ